MRDLAKVVSRDYVRSALQLRLIIITTDQYTEYTLAYTALSYIDYSYNLYIACGMQ